jgi:formate-dependent nitrite reductase membrane component NrfD
MVPEASFSSYYGRPILKPPTWEALDIAGYLFLGGLAGASSVLAAGADVLGDRGLARVSRVGAAGAITLSLVAHVHDLGRPARFLNMLRVAKPTSPMSVGSWLLTAYAPLAIGAAGLDVMGWFPRLRGVATVGAAVVGPAVAGYTAVLIADTAVPAWHGPYRELPFVFVSSAAAAGGGLGLLAGPSAQAGPARRMAMLGAGVETLVARRMEASAGLAGECFGQGRAGTLLKTARALTAAGAALALAGVRVPAAGRVGGAMLLAAAACTRFGVFAAGVASTKDPKYVVEPQRRQADERANERAATAG